MSKLKQSKQKFNIGDLVFVNVKDKQTMSHFETNFKGRVAGSYYEEYGNLTRNSKSLYTIIHPKYGEISWYNDCDLTLLRKATKQDELKVLRKMIKRF